ncbi:MFS transporter, partial [Candidatus Peregrinibacteria bacterium]|nr:MFS transporter [Candidatus Peregrinibacteria bacterium]
SDFFRRRKFFVIIGYMVAAIGKPLLAIANSFGLALGARLLDRTGKGIREAPRDALLAGGISESHRGGAFGFLKSLDTSGAVIGNLTAFLLIYLAFSIREIFWIALIPAIIAVIVVSGVKETAPEIEKKHIKIRDLMNIKEWRGKFRPDFWKFIFVAGFFAFAKVSCAFLILRADAVMHNKPLIPLLYLLYNIDFAAMAWPVGKFADKYGKRKFICAGYLLFALMSLGFIFAGNSLEVAGLFILYGVFFAFVEGNSRAFVSNVTDDSRRATALGIYNAVEGFILLPAGIIAGALWMIGDGIGTFVYSSILSSIAAVLFFFLFVYKKSCRISCQNKCKI